MKRVRTTIAALRWVSALVVLLALLLPVPPAPTPDQGGSELTTLRAALPATLGAAPRPAAELRPVLNPSAWGLPRTSTLVAVLEPRAWPTTVTHAPPDRRRDLRRTRPRRHVPRMDPCDGCALS